MLEFIRRRSTSFLSWLILIGLAAAFGLQFGLPSDSLTLGAASLAKVHGEEIRNEDFNFQFTLASRFGLVPREPQMREMIGVNEEIIDGIVERLLLTHEAERMGLAATTKQAEDLLLDGHVMLFGNRLDWLGSDEKFNYEVFTKNWLGPLRVAEPNYLKEQSNEILAQTVRDLIGASVLVPESEIRREYDKGAHRLDLRYARYDFATFADLATPTPAELDAYVTEHSDALEKQFETQKTRFTELPRQAQLRLVKVDNTPEARDALTTARASILAGRTTFADIARAQSTHDTAARGGRYGWIDEQSTSASDLPDSIRQAIPDLALNSVSALLEADDAQWMLEVTQRREGDVPLELALRELAEDAVRDQKAEQLARQAAQEDHDAIIGGASLTEIFSQPGALGETTRFGATNVEDLPIDHRQGSTSPPTSMTRPKMELRSTGEFVKGQRIPGLGDVPGLVDDAWANENDTELLDRIYEVPSAVIVAGVQSIKKPSDEQFAEQRQELADSLRRRKAQRVVEAWAKRRCYDAKGRGDINVSPSTIQRFTTYDTSPDDEQPSPPNDFVVCDRVGGGGGFLTARLRR